MGQLQKTCTAFPGWKGCREATDSWVWGLFQIKWCSDLVLQQKRMNSLLQGPMVQRFLCCGPRGAVMEVPRGCVLGRRPAA